MTSTSRSCGMPYAVMLSRPTIVVAATSALTIASSVASDHVVEQFVDHDVAGDPHLVRSEADRVEVLARSGRQRIPGREGDEQVAARVTARAADTSDPQTRALGEPLALVG